MTIEQILDCSAAQLEAMTDEQLVEWFKPYFNVTRPELAPKPTGIRTVQAPPVSFKVKQNIQKMAELGVDVSYLLRKKK